MDVRQHELPQFYLVETKEILDDNTGILEKNAILFPYVIINYNDDKCINLSSLSSMIIFHNQYPSSCISMFANSNYN